VLYDDPRNVAELRQAILDLAVRGKLVAQDPKDEPAEELVKRIDAEMLRMASSGQKSRIGARRSSRPKELQATLPTGWIPVRVDQMGEVRLGRQRSPAYHFGENMRPYVRAANVTWKGLDLSDVKQMDFPPGVFEAYVLQQDDILLNEASGSLSEVGKAVIWRNEIPNCCFQNTLIRVRLCGLWPDFVRLYFEHLARSGGFGRASQGIGINHLGAERLARTIIPLPPLAEQQRIVAKVDQLMRLCDALEAGLAQGEALRRSLTAAVLA
jgi:type I restriction enzyme S subunit